ncbi:HAMP domain-containing histidine kinase [Patescibacteria group bacterium]|nr:HAMP domain-containing histidine kinase [Patescibacteria group bacterium]MBU1954142.1 HAMP domain-containing histidine kinase [Patescibacteria group bacterium]
MPKKEKQMGGTCPYMGVNVVFHKILKGKPKSRRKGGKIYGAESSLETVARKKGKALIQIKTDIISLAAHQLRAPLSSIKWLSEMLLDGDAGELNRKQKAFIDQIQKANQRMHELIKTFLESYRLDTGEIVVESKPTKILEIINDVLKELSPKIKQKKIKLKVDISEKIPEINVVPDVVKECFEVFLLNSIKYTPAKGEINIQILTKDHEIVFEISDTGCGIPKEEQNMVFTKFFRGSNVAKLDPEGHGLGMYLVKEMAKAIGGKVWFKSSENKGTTVWFSFPKQLAVNIKHEKIVKKQKK